MKSKLRMLAQASIAALLATGAAHAQTASTTPPSGTIPPSDQAAPPSYTEAKITTIATAQGTAAQGVAQVEGDGQEIVVTGLRSTLNKASEVKRNSAQVVDSIVAEDIGKFPDRTTADALQRIPGVQVTRNAGETSGVVIRGLPNVVTTLNGRSIFTAAGRNFSYQDLPAEALGRADVFKSSQANQIEGGIAGLIDLRLHRPLDFKGLEIAGAVEGVYSRIADSPTRVEAFSSRIAGTQVSVISAYC